MLTEQLAPLSKSAAERAANCTTNEARRKAKADKQKEWWKQEKQAHDEDTSDEKEEDEGEEGTPPTIANELTWIDLTGEETGVSPSQPAMGGAGESSPRLVGEGVGHIKEL